MHSIDHGGGGITSSSVSMTLNIFLATDIIYLIIYTDRSTDNFSPLPDFTDWRFLIEHIPFGKFERVEAKQLLSPNANDVIQWQE